MERLRTSKKKICCDIITTIATSLVFVYSYVPIFTIGAISGTILLCIHGSLVALLLGHLWTDTFLRFIRNHVYIQMKKKQIPMPDVELYITPLAIPGWVTGLIERIFFGVLVAFNIQATGAGMLTWVLIKMATDWHRILPTDEGNAKSKYGPRSLAFASLLASIVSLFFALVGGLICRVALDPYLKL